MICRDVGPPNAKIMLVGDCPGKNEERTGMPFSGQNGKLLKQMLTHVGISYARCYTTVVFNERPSVSLFDYFYEDKNRIIHSKGFLDYLVYLRIKI